MTSIVSIGTYLPPWTSGTSGGKRRVKGPDEDALTMAVAAGRAADSAAIARRVVHVSRNFPLVEGGNGAVLLAALGLPGDVPVTEVLGGAPAVLDQIVDASPGTLVIGSDDNDTAVGAAAVLTGEGGADVTARGRRSRSLPLVARRDDGTRSNYPDPRLQREVGFLGTLAKLELEAGAVAGVVGVPAKQLGRVFDTSSAIEEPASSAAGVIRVLAGAIEQAGLLLAVEQAAMSVAEIAPGDTRITRDEVEPRELPKFTTAEGVGIPISMPAYSRAFEPKIRWEAAVFDERPGIDSAPQFPPRARVDDSGTLAGDYRLEPLPRTGTVYTHTTIRIPVPDLPSPYSLAVVQLDGSPVRALMKVTGVPAGEAAIGQAGAVVLRRIAIRSGIPDYGYAFWPGRNAEGVLT
ncbi:Zn-ribbon domain-containing OB-fold protein [Mycobacterium deserti]|uniref:OB-fold domain-containing protein n=1 Tax=Mycobacterium deserti TaxID=2978347 RepID=A0ABT2M4E7_9MYCO|nr:OB-fold domain-containing protein [Mycobacterium deserti]MCT7657132.1 OB-fold domain-containing protein [Mycobacterium deserti]